jgi:uncharacterized protein (UPF0335 family)
MSEPQAGHNGQLKSIVERIENLDTEIKERRNDQKEIYSEAKSNGWDVKILRKVVAIRKKDPADRAEEEALMETYLNALETGA